MEGNEEKGGGRASCGKAAGRDSERLGRCCTDSIMLCPLVHKAGITPRRASTAALLTGS